MARLNIYILFAFQGLSNVWLFETSQTATHQAPTSFTISRRLLKFLSIELVMLFKHLILCCPLLFLSSLFPSVRVFSNESVLHSRWPNSPINILGINELKWTAIGEFNSDDHFICSYGQESIRWNEVALNQQKSLKCSTWVQSQKQHNNLSLFPRQILQHHSNSSLCPNNWCQRS